MDHLIPAGILDLVSLNKKKELSISWILPFQYLDLDRLEKHLWNMKVTVIAIVVSALVTALKRLARRLEELQIKPRIVAIQTTALLKEKENVEDISLYRFSIHTKKKAHHVEIFIRAIHLTWFNF